MFAFRLAMSEDLMPSLNLGDMMLCVMAVDLMLMPLEELYGLKL